MDRTELPFSSVATTDQALRYAGMLPSITAPDRYISYDTDQWHKYIEQLDSWACKQIQQMQTYADQIVQSPDAKLAFPINIKGKQIKSHFFIDAQRDGIDISIISNPNGWGIGSVGIGASACDQITDIFQNSYSDTQLIPPTSIASIRTVIPPVSRWRDQCCIGIEMQPANQHDANFPDQDLYIFQNKRSKTHQDIINYAFQMRRHIDFNDYIVITYDNTCLGRRLSIEKFQIMEDIQGKPAKSSYQRWMLDINGNIVVVKKYDGQLMPSPERVVFKGEKIPDFISVIDQLLSSSV